MSENLIRALLLSSVVASISFFVSHTQLLAKPRSMLWKYHAFLGQLIDCCYCLGHWVAAGLLLLFPLRLFGVAWPVDYFLTWLVISWAAGLQSLAAAQLWGD